MPVRHLKALPQYRHQVKPIALQIYSLALEVIINDLLLFADDFRTARDLLKQDLHHVHLAHGQACHLMHGLLYLDFVFWGLQVS